MRNPRPALSALLISGGSCMITGFFTAWPASTWLIRAGIKEAM